MKDPVVAEVRAAKRRLERKFGNDLDAIFGELKSRENAYPRKRIVKPPRKAA